MRGSPITVGLCDDNASLRRLLVQVIDGQRDVDVVGEAASAEELIELLGEVVPDVVVLDVNLPGLSGLEGIGRIREVGYAKPIVVMSADRRNEDPARAAGASAFFYKGSTEVTLLLDAIRTAADAPDSL